MYYNAVITIKKFTGDATSKTQSTLGSSIRALLQPASAETLAFYPDLPIGQSFAFTLLSDDITSIPPESEIVVTDTMNGDLTLNDKFIIKGETRKNKIAGQTYFNGVAIKKGA